MFLTIMLMSSVFAPEITSRQIFAVCFIAAGLIFLAWAVWDFFFGK